MKKSFKLPSILSQKAIILFSILLLGLSLQVQAQPGSDRLNAGEQMHVGMPMVSSNGQYELMVQPSGYLTLKKNGTEIWASQQFSNLSILRMQQDAQLVLYNQQNNAVMDSNTYFNGPNEQPYVKLTNAGELMITKFEVDGEGQLKMTLVNLIPSGFRVL